jgi:hypothetical protein
LGIHRTRRQINFNYCRGTRLKPYVQYLLGVAYEMARQPDQAYRDLWNDYPSNPFTYVGQQRLALVNP